MTSLLYSSIHVIIILTLLITFLSNYYSSKIKRLFEINAISNIIQIDVLFDLIIWIFMYDENVRIFELVYSLTLPIIVIINGLFPSLKNRIYFYSILFICLIAFYNFDYVVVLRNNSYLIILSIILQLLAIVVCSYNVLKHKRIIKTVNYLFYLMLGFLILDFFWYLGFENIIKNKFDTFRNYHYFYTCYLCLFRLIYIFYVLKYIRTSWILTNKKIKSV